MTFVWAKHFYSLSQEWLTLSPLSTMVPITLGTYCDDFSKNYFISQDLATEKSINTSSMTFTPPLLWPLKIIGCRTNYWIFGSNLPLLGKWFIAYFTKIQVELDRVLNWMSQSKYNTECMNSQFKLIFIFTPRQWVIAWSIYVSLATSSFSRGFLWRFNVHLSHMSVGWIRFIN